MEGAIERDWGNSIRVGRESTLVVVPGEKLLVGETARAEDMSVYRPSSDSGGLRALRTKSAGLAELRI